MTYETISLRKKIHLNKRLQNLKTKFLNKHQTNRIYTELLLKPFIRLRVKDLRVFSLLRRKIL